MEAAFRRNIKTYSDKDKLYPASNGKDQVIVKRNAGVGHTINLILHVVYNTLSQTAALAKTLLGSNLNETCRNIWNHMYTHYQYKRDMSGVEQVRTPSRAWADRFTGIDCDCYATTISSILVNLKIPHALRITKYNGKSNYSHIYVVVPKNADLSKQNLSVRANYYVIDPVPDKYDYEAPFTGYTDIPVMGNAKVDLAKSYESLNGILNLGELRTVEEYPVSEFILPPGATKSNSTTSLLPESQSNFILPPNIGFDKALPVGTKLNLSSASQKTPTKSGYGILAFVLGLSVVNLGGHALLSDKK